MDYIHKFRVGGEAVEVPHAELEDFYRTARDKGLGVTGVSSFRMGNEFVDVPDNELGEFHKAAREQGLAVEEAHSYTHGGERMDVPASEMAEFWQSRREMGLGPVGKGGIEWDGEMPAAVKGLDLVVRGAQGAFQGAYGGIKGLVDIVRMGRDLVIGEGDGKGILDRVSGGLGEAVGVVGRELGGAVTQKNVWDSPEVLADPDWWAAGVGNAVGSMIPMVAPGGVVGQGAKALAASASGIGGAMAAGQSYDRQREQGGAILPSATKAAAVGVAIGALEKVGLDRVFGPEKSGIAMGILKKFAAEGGEEGLENPVTALIENLGMVGPTEYGQRVLQAMKEGIGEGVLGGVVGAGMGAGSLRGGAGTEPGGGSVVVAGGPPTLDDIREGRVARPIEQVLAAMQGAGTRQASPAQEPEVLGPEVAGSGQWVPGLPGRSVEGSVVPPPVGEFVGMDGAVVPRRGTAGELPARTMEGEVAGRAMPAREMEGEVVGRAMPGQEMRALPTGQGAVSQGAEVAGQGSPVQGKKKGKGNVSADNAENIIKVMYTDDIFNADALASAEAALSPEQSKRLSPVISVLKHRAKRIAETPERMKRLGEAQPERKVDLGEPPEERMGEGWTVVKREASAKQKVPVTKQEGVLDRAEKTVKARIRKIKGEGRLGAGLTGVDPELMATMTALGAIKIAKGIRDFTAWTAEMVREFGESVRPHLQEIWQASLERARTFEGGANGKKMHGTAERVAAEPLGEDVPGRAGSYYEAVSFTDAAEQAAGMSMEDLQQAASQLGASLDEHQTDMGAIAGAEAFNRLHAEYVRATRSGDAKAIAAARAARGAWLDRMNTIGMTAARVLAQMRYLKAGLPGAQLALIEKEMERGGWTMRPEDRTEIVKALEEHALAERELSDLNQAVDENPGNEKLAGQQDAALNRVQKAKQRLLNAKRIVPGKLVDALVYGMQMDAMVPVGLIGNMAGNVLFQLPDALARGHRAAGEWLISRLPGQKRKPWAGLTVRELKAGAAAVRELPKGLLNIALTGQAGTLRAGGEMGGFAPLRAWADLLAGRLARDAKTGAVSKEQVASKLYEGTIGLFAEPMGRVLKMGDYGFTAPITAMNLVEMGREKGLDGAALEAYLANPPAKDVAKAEEAAKFLAFQGRGASSTLVNKGLRQMKEAGRVGEVGYFQTRAGVALFVTTPLNMMSRAMRYTPFGLGFAQAAARRGDMKDARMGVARVIVGMEMLAGLGALASLGLLFGNPDEKERREKQKKAIGINSVNMSGLRRVLARMRAGSWTRDDLEAAAKLREGDESWGFNYMGLPGWLANVVANAKLDVDRDRMSTNPYVRNEGTVGQWTEKLFLNSWRATLDLSMAKGAMTFLNAIARKDTGRWAPQTAATIAGVVLPRTTEAEMDAIYTWAPEVQAPETGYKIGAQIAQRVPGPWYAELPVQRDYFGRPVRNTPEGMNPWMARNVDVAQRGRAAGKIDLELFELMNATGSLEAYPTVPEFGVFTELGQPAGTMKEKLTPAETSRFLRHVGSARLALVQQVVGKGSWKGMGDKEKVAVLKSLYETGKKVGTDIMQKELDGKGTKIPGFMREVWDAAGATQR